MRAHEVGGSPRLEPVEGAAPSPHQPTEQEGKTETVTTNLALPQDDRQLCHAEALCTLLARADLSDVCTWTMHTSGIEGQLSAIYSDPEAHDRLRELADLLTSGRLATQPRPGHTSLEAVGTVEGSPVRFWTHIHDRDPLTGEVRR